MTHESLWLTAADAASMLRVSRATLYAYVSRGYVRSQSMPGEGRERGYSREDVDRLRRRTEERRNPDKAAARALHWGVPILESSITLIDGNSLYYRGHDALTLARTRTLAEVASLVWTGRFDAAFTADPLDAPAVRRTTDDILPFALHAQTVLARASARDPLAFDTRAGAAARTGWRILQLLCVAATRSNVAMPTIDGALARTWGVRSRGADLLRAALILCADHELNVSSFTARAVASAGSNPYAVVIGGLAALQGTRHGGATVRVESQMEATRRAKPLRTAVMERLRRGEPVDGFGHPLYRQGDPRAALLIELLRDRYSRSAELAFVVEFAESARAALREKPNIDFALAAVSRVLRLPPGSPITLFAIGRSIGWIGHAIEQYETGQLIRPRAKYVGVVPA